MTPHISHIVLKAVTQIKVDKSSGSLNFLQENKQAGRIEFFDSSEEMFESLGI